MVRTKPQFPDEKTMQLRYDLIKEELNELEHAMKTKNLKEVADALTDILYVTYGAGYAYGIDLDKCFKEVQRANMSKLGTDGKPIYNEKGKVMKGPNYSEPNLKQFVE
jgi:predicted HAD superfamily Cof-like phosphohydrolase